MTDEDIYAFHPVPTPVADTRVSPPARKRRIWPWLLGAALLLSVVLAASCAAAMLALAEAGRHGLNVSINGEPWQGGADLGAAHGAVALLGVGTAVLLVLLIVPCVVVLALTLAGLAVASGLTIAAGAVAVVLAVALSPLWLLGLLLWLLLRRPAVAPG